MGSEGPDYSWGGRREFRGDASTERFNGEGTSRGFLSEPDSYYETWPRELTEAERSQSYFLTSLTPREELAVFITTRGHALFDLGRADEAKAAYELALRLSPRNISATVWANRASAILAKPDDAEEQYLASDQ